MENCPCSLAGRKAIYLKAFAIAARCGQYFTRKGLPASGCRITPVYFVPLRTAITKSSSAQGSWASEFSFEHVEAYRTIYFVKSMANLQSCGIGRDAILYIARRYGYAVFSIPDYAKVRSSLELS